MYINFYNYQLFNMGRLNLGELIPEETIEEKENWYAYRLINALDLDEKDVEIVYNNMHINYPNMTKDEIIEALERQKDYRVILGHQHKWITAKLIKRYLLLDQIGFDTVKVTLETPELHDSNLIKLTPELQKRTYRWYRWDRKVPSQMIDKKDCPDQNKTNKLTVVIKRKDNWDDTRYPNFLVLTSYRWDWFAPKEPKVDGNGQYDFSEMEFWVNHALTPEEGEVVIRADKIPEWLSVYKEMKEQINKRENE